MGCTCDGGDWTAVLDRIPPQPQRLRVRGTATCTSGGYTNVRLEQAPLQGINPRILLLELVWTEPTGMSAAVMTPHPVEYREANSADYDQVQIVNCADTTITVQKVD